MRRRWFSMWMGAFALLVATPTLAAEPVVTTILFESELWALNGDTVRQPNLPLIQKLVIPGVTLTDTLSVTPNANAVTKVGNFVPNFAGGATFFSISKTTMGNQLQLANPLNINDPFTGILTNEAHNQTGTAMFDAGSKKWTAEVAVDVTTDICLDKEVTFTCFFIANLSLPGAVGVSAGTAPIVGHVAQLSIPIEGTLLGQGWTTGMATVTKQLITKRKNDDPAGTPTGFTTVTFTDTGFKSSMKLVFVTPIVADSFVGVGENRVPNPLIGFARSTVTGATYVVPEPGALLLAAGAAVLAVLGRRRLRKA